MEWELQQVEDEEQGKQEIESLMKLVALEEVKERFLDIKSKIEICRQQKASVKKDRFNAVFQGNPGTGMYNSVLRG